jgi:response regulator RpfG family c-di-GMP phosphodiesterase
VNDLVILCVEDEPEVRAALVRDLEVFAGIARIDEAEDAEDAEAALEEMAVAGDRLGLVLADHRLPGMSGVDLLVELHHRPGMAAARKVLVTGQADLADTVRAVNEGGLDHFIAKPWTPEQLHDVVREQLTSFVVEEVEDLLPYVEVLHAPRLLEALRDRLADR